MASLSQLAAAHGVATSYLAAGGRRVAVPEDAVAAVLDALGVPGAGETGAGTRPLLPPAIALSGLPGDGVPAPLRTLPEGTDLVVVTEDGQETPWRPRPPAHPSFPGLPPGYHTLLARAPGGRTARARLIVPPGPLPAPARRRFGLLTRLTALGSLRSWGRGDLVDLADLASWAGHTLGAGFLVVDPLHAAVPEDGPGRPGNRRYPDPVHLRIEDIPEFPYLAPEDRRRLEPVLAGAADLRRAALAQGTPGARDAVWALKRRALEILRAVPLSPGRRAAYHAYLAEQGQALEDHATWCALAELYGPDWRLWPPGLRDPRSPDTARARADHLERVDFHSWLTWLADTQLARVQRVARAAGMDIGLVHTLAPGAHPHGSEAWTAQGLLARGMSLGEPPGDDHPEGRDWGVPPWCPSALAGAGYEPWREPLAGVLRHAGGVRTGPLAGLYRQWWIPEGAPPDQGTYVTLDPRAVLAVLALEAHRAGALVLGELPPPGPEREAARRLGLTGVTDLAAAGPGLARAWDRGRGAPAARDGWPGDGLAAVTLDGRDPATARLAAPGASAWLDLFARLGLMPRGAGEERRLIAAHRFLARTPARLVGVWLADAAGPPPRRGGAATLEEITASPRAVALARAVREELGEGSPGVARRRRKGGR